MCFSDSLENLNLAIKINDIGIVRDIVSKSPGIINLCKCVDLPEGQFTPLWNSMMLGRKEIVELLVDFGADVNEKFRGHHTFFHQMTLADDSLEKTIKIAKILINQGADVNAGCGTTGESALQIAIEKGNLRCAKFLLENGARLVDGPEWNTISPIAFVLQAPQQRQAKMLQLLIEKGLDVESQNANGTDCLLLAVKRAIHGYETDVLGIAKVLASSGQEFDGLDSKGLSTFVRAVELGNKDLVSFLIERGADVNQRCKFDGLFPLYAAAYKNNVEMLDLLITNGAEINAKSNRGWTALHAACWFRREKVIKFLLDKGAYLKAETNTGKTPFHFLKPKVCQESDISCIDVMVREIAKQKFLDESSVSRNDLDLMQLHESVKELYDKYSEELDQMTKTKFYGPYTYGYVLRLSKTKVKKLVSLTKNKEFVLMYEENLQNFTNYGDDLKKILEEAMQLRDRSLTLESRLRTAVADFFPDVVLGKLMNNLTVEDLLPS